VVSINDFDEYLLRKSLCLKHWGLPYTEIKLKKITSGKYFLEIYLKGELVFENTENFSYEIHFGEKERLCGLFVKSSSRGWFLEQIDIFEETNIGIGIIVMLKNRMELMHEIYDRETLVRL
jgi:hypothetical protein